MTADLPDDLRADTGREPDFRRPTVIDNPNQKSSAEAEALIEQLEEAGETHSEATRRTIEGR